MTMVSSLKALLFSTAAAGAPQGVAAGADGGAPDFAAMLGDRIAGEAAPEPVLSFEVTPPVEGEPTLDLPVEIAEPGMEDRPARSHKAGMANGLAVAVAAGKGAPASLPPGRALGLVRRMAEAEPALPAVSQAGAEAGPLDEAIAPAEMTLSEAPAETIVPAPPSPVLPPKATKTQEAPPVEAEASADPRPAKEPKARDKEDKPEVKVESLAVSTLPAPTIVPLPQAETMPTRPPKNDGSAQPEAVSSPVAVAPMPVAPELPQQGLVNADSPPQLPTQPGRAASPAAPAEDGRAASARAVAADVMVENLPGEQAAPSPSGSEPASAPVSHGKPLKSEALALLQLAREQVAARQSGAQVRVGEQVSAVAKKGQPAAAAAAEPAPIFSPSGPSPDLAQSAPVQAAQPAQPQVVSTAAPVVDLSASLGAQAIDMGVSGQWIDGLARDIAGLSAHGAQGRFQIKAEQLGAVQVDIRQGTDGAAVNLTVASEAAEMALRQDSDRLKIDAGFAAVRIADLKIERAPVAEAARADGAGQHGAQQQSQHSSSQAHAAWSNGSQDMNQPQGQQGRSQARQNNGFDPKSSDNPAVLNQELARPVRSEAARARYA
ncbi:MAG TPA: flagellar hook-length control protein FliK [Sphingobium sp.]|nr:flagellar hook-length control protein FliK [Sphingobium sp.]